MEGSMSVWLLWWQHADWLVRGVFLILLALSFFSWTVLIYKLWQFRRWSRLEQQAAREWQSPGGDVRLLMARLAPDQPSAVLGLVADHELRLQPAGRFDRQSAADRLDQGLREVRIVMESGLSFLASVGSASPFIGLLGTVWGIMHALNQLGGGKTPSLDLIAGPVAEALAATAAGLFAALPALFGYNFLVRRLRRLNTAVEGNALRVLDRLQESLAPAAAEEAGS